MKLAISWLVTDVKETFDLQVNDSSMEELLFLEKSFRLKDDHQVKLCTATIKINGMRVVDETFDNTPGWLTHRILDVIGEEPISELEMGSILNTVDASTPVLSEVFATLFRLAIEENGLKKFQLYNFGNKMQSRIDESITCDIVAQCKNLEVLIIYEML